MIIATLVLTTVKDLLSRIRQLDPVVICLVISLIANCILFYLYNKINTELKAQIELSTYYNEILENRSKILERLLDEDYNFSSNDIYIIDKYILQHKNNVH